MIKKLFYNNFKKELAVYADSSWKDGTAAFSYTDTHSKTFYVSNLFNCDSSVSAECYGAYCAIIHGIKTATMYNYNTITVYTDLLKLESLNNDKKNKMYKKENIVNNILKHIEIIKIIYGLVCEICKELLNICIGLIHFNFQSKFKYPHL